MNLKIIKELSNVKIGLTSPREIQEWGERSLKYDTFVGEVTSEKTFLHKKHEAIPEMEGLFCQKIFGPVKSYFCACGKRINRKLRFCKFCGVERTSFRVRRHRFGHIKLSYPIIHSLYASYKPSPLTIFLNWDNAQINNVISTVEFCYLSLSFFNFFYWYEIMQSSHIKMIEKPESYMAFMVEKETDFHQKDDEEMNNKEMDDEENLITLDSIIPLTNPPDLFFPDFFEEVVENYNLIAPPKDYLMYGINYDMTWDTLNNLANFFIYFDGAPLRDNVFSAFIPYYSFLKEIKDQNFSYNIRQNLDNILGLFPVQTSGAAIEKILAHYDPKLLLKQLEFEFRFINILLNYIKKEFDFFSLIDLLSNGVIDARNHREDEIFEYDPEIEDNLVPMNTKDELESEFESELKKEEEDDDEIEQKYNHNKEDENKQYYNHEKNENEFNYEFKYDLDEDLDEDLEEDFFIDLEESTNEMAKKETKTKKEESNKTKKKKDTKTKRKKGNKTEENKDNKTKKEESNKTKKKKDTKIEDEEYGDDVLSLVLFFQTEWSNLKQMRRELLRRLDCFRKIYLNNMQPAWIVLSCLPVLPPDLRPVTNIEDDSFLSDLSKLYQIVIIRNNQFSRLKRLKKLEKFIGFDNSSLKNYWDILCYNIQYLQKAVNSLIQTGEDTLPEYTSFQFAKEKNTKKSLLDSLKGKKGRFRQHLLGKRVDFSGRSVIVVGPSLKIYECGLPIDMAIELFQPYIIQKLVEMNISVTTIKAKIFIAENKFKIWDLLKEIMRGHPIILNRAPTLHRLGIQAFFPKPVLEKTIRLHPLVCSAFNADFDGDQMAVHIPLTFSAQAEALHLIWSRNNILSPASGQPLLVPAQDMVLGCFFLTSTAPLTYSTSILNKLDRYKIFFQQNDKKSLINFFSSHYIKTFHNSHEIRKICEIGQLDIHTPIWIFWSKSFQTMGDITEAENLDAPIEYQIDCFGNTVLVEIDRYKIITTKTYRYIRTTPGRLFFYELI